MIFLVSNVVYSMKGIVGDKFSFKVLRSGMYKFCFYNLYFVSEIVFFYIYVGYIFNEYNFVKDG